MIESQSHNIPVSKTCGNCANFYSISDEGYILCPYASYGMCTPESKEEWEPTKSNNLRMTNKEASDILRKMLMPRFGCTPRGNGKSYMLTQVIEALAKAIKVLEETPDE